MTAARTHAYLQLLAVAVIWGIAGPIIKITLKHLTPEVFLLYRFFLSSIVAVFILTKHKGQRPKGLKMKLTATLYAFLNSTAALGFLFWGTDKTTLLNMSLISLFGPILMMIFGYMFLKEHLTKRMKIGALITFLGATTIALEPVISGTHNSSAVAGEVLGNTLIFFSLLCGAISGLLAKKLLKQGVSPAFLTNYSFLVGFVTLIPIVLYIQSPSQIIQMVQGAKLPDHLGVLYMALVSGSIAYTLTNSAQKTIELSETAIFSYLYPIFSAILAVILLGDKISLVTIIACLVTFAGVFVAEIKKKRYT